LDIHRVKIDLCTAAVRDVLKMHLLIFRRVWRWARGELQYASRYDERGGPVGKEIAGLIFPRPLGHDHHVKCVYTNPMN